MPDVRTLLASMQRARRRRRTGARDLLVLLSGRVSAIAHSQRHCPRRERIESDPYLRPWVKPRDLPKR